MAYSEETVRGLTLTTADGVVGPSDAACWVYGTGGSALALSDPMLGRHVLFL